MQWTKPPPAKGCSQSYYLESDRYTIAKVFAYGVPQYHLWRGEEHLGVFDTAVLAMEKASGEQ